MLSLTTTKRAGSPTSQFATKALLFPAAAVATSSSSSQQQFSSSSSSSSMLMRRNWMMFASTTTTSSYNFSAISVCMNAMRLKSTESSYLVSKRDPHHKLIKGLVESKPSSFSMARKFTSAADRSANSSSMMMMTPVKQKSSPKKQQQQQQQNFVGSSVASFITAENTLRRNHEYTLNNKVTRTQKQELSPGRVHPPPGKTISPQLAHVWEDHHQKFPDSTTEKQLFVKTNIMEATEDAVMVSLKLDGVRATIQSKSTKGNNVPVQVWRDSEKRIVAQSRHKKEFFSISRITSALEPLFDMFPSLVLDGEIYRHDADFNDLSGAVRSQEMFPDDETRALQSGLQFFVFDIANYEFFNVKKMDYVERMKILRKMLRAGVDPKLLSLPDEIHAADFHQSRSRVKAVRTLFQSFKKSARSLDKPIAFLDSVMVKKEDIETCRDMVVDELKLEGLMVRHQRAAYTANRRSPYLLKVKKMQDAEFRIIGFSEGEGKLKGCMGAFVLKAKNGSKFKASFSGPEPVKKKLWILRKRLLGHLATVHFQELSSKGVPRFPIVKGIRGKSKKDCI